MAPSKIMVIRHAEKPADDDMGINIEGQLDKESLIVRGWQRAGALVPFFAPTNGRLQNDNLARPDVIYASRPISPSEKANGKKGSKSERPLETITPLAQRLGITPNTRFVEGEEKEMVASAVAQHGVVLISWQHEQITKIANYIVGSKRRKSAIPAKWPGARFDIVWVFTPRVSSPRRWDFVQVSQQLLSGDRKAVIRRQARPPSRSASRKK